MPPDDKEKKAAMKAVDDMRGNFSDMRGLINQLGKQLDDHDKAAATLLGAIQKDNEAEQKKRWEEQQKLQNKIFSTMQDITSNKAKTSDKAFKAIDGYIRS